MSDYIGTGILEVCGCPESVADRWNGFGRVLGGKSLAKIYWHRNSGSHQKVSQTDESAWKESQEFKTVFSSIGTGILEVCECPESVTEQWRGFGRVGTCARVCLHVCMYI